MFNRLPLEMLFSGLIWVVLIFTIFSCFQLIVFEKIIKRDYPHHFTYSQMSSENKQKIHKYLLKMIIGILLMGLLVIIDKY